MRRQDKSFGERSPPSGRPRSRNRGAALLLTMFLVAIIGVMLTVAGRVWHTEMQREKEVELLVVGGEIARAITRYHAASLQYPENLDQLLRDSRQQNTVRYLRRLYRDPITGGKTWGLIKDVNGRITGVYSLGKGEPLKQAGFDTAQAKFKGAKSYADWTFVAEPGNTASAVVPRTAGAHSGPSADTPNSPSPSPEPPTN
jgi:type II secretory pathway pseudopilin PulG